MVDRHRAGYAKEYREKHREEINATHRAYRLRNKEKVSERRRKYYLSHKNESLEYSKMYREGHREEFNEYGKKWRDEHYEEWLENHKKYQQKYVKNNPDVAYAHNMVHNAIASKKITPQPCEVCGLESAEAHHDDYNKPLEVRWLCKKHHAEWHRDNKPIKRKEF